jgi:lysophospholipase
MFQQQKDWETRENAFAAFSMGPLTDFWRQREEAEFTGVDDIPVHFVRFHAEKNDRVIVVCPGRIESYVKYAELAYDLFHSGLTCSLSITVVRGVPGACAIHIAVMSITLMTMSTINRLWQQEVLPGPWRKRYILAHSMGGAIATLFLQRHPNQCDAIALCAPMFGIVMRFPTGWRHILDWLKGIRDPRRLCDGTGRWRRCRSV